MTLIFKINDAAWKDIGDFVKEYAEKKIIKKKQLFSGSCRALIDSYNGERIILLCYC